jgi:hypothetical protein
MLILARNDASFSFVWRYDFIDGYRCCADQIKVDPTQRLLPFVHNRC